MSTSLQSGLFPYGIPNERSCEILGFYSHSTHPVTFTFRLPRSSQCEILTCR